MTLRINIEHRKQVYTAGDTVSGTVKLVGGEDVGVQSISVTFSGRSKSKIRFRQGNTDSTYRGRVSLFHFEQILFRGPHTLHPNEHSWPFSFQFPQSNQCQISTGGFDKFQNHNSRFNDDPNQLLPGSYMLHETGSWDPKMSGFVTYHLEANLEHEGTRIFRPYTSTTEERLRFVQPRLNQSPNPQLLAQNKSISCHTMHLLPGMEHRHLTMRERMSALTSKALPSAYFKLILGMPRVGVLGQALPFYLGVEHDFEKSTAPSPPRITLRKCFVALESRGTMRALNDDFYGTFRSDGDITESWEDETTIADIRFEENSPPVSERMDLRDHMDLKLKPQLCIYPSFSTFNLNLQYQLRVKLQVECAREKFDSYFTVNPVELLAGDWIGCYQGCKGAELGSGNDTYGPVPTYQQALEPTSGASGGVEF